MNIFRYILFPFALVYGGITSGRNLLYKKRVFKSSKFDLPIICIGNLSMGGTGKTPHTEYLTRLLKNEFNLAILSRGYGRKTADYIEADENSTASIIGDEPAQYNRKFNDITVAVEKKRVKGVLNLLYDHPDINLILLDDAYQHRSLSAGFNIMITSYNSPFYKDNIFPIGTLRELKKGKDRADIIIVSKCPEDLSKEEQNAIISRIEPANRQKVFFTRIKYGRIYNPFNDKTLDKPLNNFKVLALTGIANPNPLYDMLSEQQVKFEKKAYRDHYPFSEKDATTITNLFDTFVDSDKIILTTEKDASRLIQIKGFKKLPIYCIEIEVDFINEKDIFDKTILEYVRGNQADFQLPEGEDQVYS